MRDQENEYILGTWEGEAQNMFAGIMNGIGIKDVTICGEGTIDGNASWENWWLDAKRVRGAARPRMIFESMWRMYNYRNHSTE